MNTVSSVLCVLSASVILAGCVATPDMSRWAQNSSALATAISAENAEVLKRMTKNIAAYNAGVEIGWDIPKTYASTWNEDSRKTYAMSATTIDATMTAMTLYADALAKLASSGETGREAVDKGQKALKSIADTVGVTFPDSSTVFNLVKEIADVWNRAEAQAGLLEAMELTDPKIEVLRDEVKKAVEAQRKLVENLRIFEDSIIVHSYGENAMQWYFQRDATSKMSRFERNEQIFKEAMMNDDHMLVAGGHTLLVETLKERAEARARDLAAAAQWRATRLSQLNGIDTAVDLWGESHKGAMAALRECDGLQAFRINCGSYTAENLRVLASRIRNAVVPDGARPGDIQPVTSTSK